MSTKEFASPCRYCDHRVDYTKNPNAKNCHDEDICHEWREYRALIHSVKSRGIKREMRRLHDYSINADKE